MNRTKAILVLAALLAVTAILLTRTTSSRAPDRLPPVNPPPVTRMGPVALGTGLSGAALLRGGPGEVYLDLSMKVDRGSRTNSAPVSVALVIDRSGSMAGQKLMQARAAARKLVQSLRPGDRLALITYGSDVTTLVPSILINEASRARLLAAVAGITYRGGTYLSGGFEAGRDELLKASAPGQLRRVILISDGQANEGITSTTSLAAMARDALARGIHLTTMGVGLEFNEDLMTSMAEHGGGHYYFIEDATALASIFSRELKTLTSAVAREASLEITLAPGVELQQLYGYAYEQRGQVITVKLPDMFGGQERKVICKLLAPTGAAGEKPLAETKLAFTEVTSGRLVTLSSAATVLVTDDAARIKAGRDRAVLARAEQANISASLSSAMESYATGDLGGARDQLNNQIQASVVANKELKSSELDRIVGKLRRQLRTAEEAEPASAPGRALIKGGKFDAYKYAK